MVRKGASVGTNLSDGSAVEHLHKQLQVSLLFIFLRFFLEPIFILRLTTKLDKCLFHVF